MNIGFSFVDIDWWYTAGAYAGFLRGGPNFKISGILNIHAAKLRAFVRGVWGHAPPQ